MLSYGVCCIYKSEAFSSFSHNKINTKIVNGQCFFFTLSLIQKKMETINYIVDGFNVELIINVCYCKLDRSIKLREWKNTIRIIVVIGAYDTVMVFNFRSTLCLHATMHFWFNILLKADIKQNQRYFLR